MHLRQFGRWRRSDWRQLDGSSSGSGCNVDALFDLPVLVEGVNGTTSEEADATLSLDQLTIYFASNRLGSFDLFSASRSNVGDPFTDVTRLESLVTAARDMAPSVTADQKTLYFARDPDTPDPWGIYFATRADAASPFGDPAFVPNIDSVDSDWNSFELPSSAVPTAVDFVSSAELATARTNTSMSLKNRDAGPHETRSDAAKAILNPSARVRQLRVVARSIFNRPALR